ncbi:hypothetical protein R3W88_002947 [Solanum pinnatisectum]|uniref:RNase H type-1 domain-containing protein n=1 Tax=Solanum pinnatisectum TaxID=50273 RepID=A0AAV9MQS9_9SOLN|nr:hypothetical protein R3W88_002947 [Solanum pinnatisectum]
MNVDGTFHQEEKTAGIGGVIRNHMGDWVTGFTYKSMAQNHTTAEIEAFHTGLILADSLKLGNPEIETDSAEILQLLDHAKPPYDIIISDCRSLLRKLQNPVVRHSFRQGNYVADILAKQGSRLTNYDKTTLLQSPPDSVNDQLAKDKNGVTSTRTIKSSTQ